jgi:hypothetical protein
MRTVVVMTLCLLAACVLAVNGCGKKADETKPMSEVQAEAEKMDVSQLKSKAAAYKDAIVAKKAEMEKLATRLKEIPVTEMLGEKAKALKAQIEKVTGSLSALKERFGVYYQKLKDKGGDLSGLDI